jgi:hypothetical protein
VLHVVIRSMQVRIGEACILELVGLILGCYELC